MNTRRGSLASFAASSNSRPDKPHGAVVDTDLAGAMVDDQRSGFDDLRLADQGSPEERPHPCEQLEVDVTGHDVVRAALESAHPRDRIRVGLGQHDHWHIAVPRATRLA